MSLLAIRFVRWIAAISIVITLAGICVATYLEYRNDVRDVRDQVESVETFVPTLSTSVWRLDDDQIEIQLQGIVRLPAVQQAAIEIAGEISYQESAGPADSGSLEADARYPLVFDSAGVRHDLGTLLISADPSYATSRIPVFFFEIATIQGIRGLIIAAVFFWVFSHLVGNRLKSLSRDIGALNWENLQSQSIPRDSIHDELAEVRGTLESMRIKIVEGIEREKEVEEKLKFRQLFDPVTGLPNRTLLTDRLETLRRSGTSTPLVVVALEMLRLPEIDYMLDRSLMDEALRKVADTLQEQIDPGGLLSRYSERCFVLVVGPLSGRKKADALVADIAAKFERPFHLSPEQDIFFSAAFGIATSEDDDGDLDAQMLLSRANLALDVAVSRGDGTWVHWGKDLQHEGASIYQELRTSLNEEAFELYCQPIVDLKTLRVESMECLIRWHSDRLMSYGIQNSIHLLEQSGLSGLLDRSVLDSALALRGRLLDVYRGPISINLTAKSLSDEAYFDYVGQQKNELLLDLELELTETNVLHDVASAQQLASRFRELGARLVLDDFGTGFSSIEYLSQFQFHAIKIDRSFLRDGLNNQRRLLQSMVSIAHGVGSRVVAEGIESEWQLNLARCLEVDYGQGYLFSKPLCESDLRDFLVSHRGES